ncbi:hypothetical protein PIB30_075481 [Stylosanthes scabra]|uniref:Uncharacterized protein n=1 Tax=Stylosanthes scabra TaxID=79078 RepID=A0ABU6RQC8_9FABA|nr:hypothetical protein [Stylosanthes scabra]
MDGARGDSFLALVYHNGKIKKRTSEGVRFKYECPTNVFISAVVSSGVKYDRFSVESDEDLQVLFHRRQQFPEVRTTELYVEIADVGASSGGSNPHPQQVHVGPTHCPPDVGGPTMGPVASPSFDVNLQGNDDGSRRAGTIG